MRTIRQDVTADGQEFRQVLIDPEDLVVGAATARLVLPAATAVDQALGIHVPHIRIPSSCL